jgi:hypothetical protein
MLFSYGNEYAEPVLGDALVRETPLECIKFDRPLLLPGELHLAGAMAFAATFGLSGMTLLEWALLQTLDSPEYGLSGNESFLATALSILEREGI